MASTDLKCGLEALITARTEASIVICHVLIQPLGQLAAINAKILLDLLFLERLDEVFVHLSWRRHAKHAGAALDAGTRSYLRTRRIPSPMSVHSTVHITCYASAHIATCWKPPAAAQAAIYVYTLQYLVKLSITGAY